MKQPRWRALVDALLSTGATGVPTVNQEQEELKPTASLAQLVADLQDDALANNRPGLALLALHLEALDGRDLTHTAVVMSSTVRAVLKLARRAARTVGETGHTSPAMIAFEARYVRGLAVLTVGLCDELIHATGV